MTKAPASQTGIENLEPQKPEMAVRTFLKFLLGCLIVLGGCKGCDKESVPPKEIPPSANFKFYDQVGPDGAQIGAPELRLIETDTFYLSKAGSTYSSIRIIYVASDTSCDSYSWKVGDDPRIFDKKVSALYFSAPGLYPVKLKVSKTFKDGTVLEDSVTRNFRIIQTEYHPIIGKYIGFNVSKPDSLFKFFIGHGSEGSFVWNVDTIKQFNANSSYVMTGLQGKMYSAHSVVLTSKGAWKDLTWDPLPKFANNFILKSVFIIPNARYDSIQIDYFKIKIPSEHPSGPELFTAEKFIGKRYL